MVDLVHDPSCTHSVLLSYCMLKDVKKGINKGGLCDSVWRFTNSVRPPLTTHKQAIAGHNK